MQSCFQCLPRRIAALVAALALLSSTAQAQVKLGAMGDSYTDEYSALGVGLMNWVDLLVASGKADFGPFAQFPSGDPRNTPNTTGSYTYNYARSGATTSSALGSTTFSPTVQNNNSQSGSPNRPDLWPGILGAGTSGAIKYASQDLGGNDMLGLISNNKLLTGLDTNSMNPIISRFEQATNIATANFTSPLKMVLVQYPDLGSMPLLAAYPQSAQASVRQNVAYFNSTIAAFGAQHGVPTVDLFSLWDNIRNSGGTTVDGVNISPGTSSGGLADLHSVWLADGLHPTPIFQAMWANQFISTLDNFYGEQIPLLTDQQMVTLTGLVVPEPPSWILATAGLALFAIARRWRRVQR